MILQLTLTPELEYRLRREAERQGLSPDALVLKLLQEHLPPADRCIADIEEERRAAAVAMLKQWAAEDEAMTEEDATSNLAVLRAIDANRAAGRKLFTDVLKDEPE